MAKDIEPYPDLEYNLNSSLLKMVRPCKSIRPKNSAAERNYSGILPRIVKSNFKVPPNWEAVEEVRGGQVLEKEEYESHWGREFIHTCHKPYDKCVRGFWVVKGKKLPPLRG